MSPDPKVNIDRTVAGSGKQQRAFPAETAVSRRDSRRASSGRRKFERLMRGAGRSQARTQRMPFGAKVAAAFLRGAPFAGIETDVHAKRYRRDIVKAR
jgi:hypothetical protein